MEQNAITQAVKAAGGQSALARILGCRPQAVNKWCATGKAPAERVIAVENATGINRSALRPDLYPEAATAA